MSLQIKILKQFKNKCPICQTKLTYSSYKDYICFPIKDFKKYHMMEIYPNGSGKFIYNKNDLNVRIVWNFDKNIKIFISSISKNIENILDLKFTTKLFQSFGATQESFENKINRMFLLK